jgi:hypothetical protein
MIEIVKIRILFNCDAFFITSSCSHTLRPGWVNRAEVFNPLPFFFQDEIPYIYRYSRVQNSHFLQVFFSLAFFTGTTFSVTIHVMTLNSRG